MSELIKEYFKKQQSVMMSRKIELTNPGMPENWNKNLEFEYIYAL